MIPKEEKRKIGKWEFIKLKKKKIVYQRTVSKNEDKLQSWRKYLAIMYLIKDLYPEYIKSIYYSTIKDSLI